MDIVERLKRAAPIQDRFGPSLPQLIAPRIDRVPAIARRAAIVAVVVVAAVVVALVLRTRNPAYSHSGAPATFTVTWPRSMKRAAAPPGTLLALRQADGNGLVASFVVTPLRLPRYSGEISGLLPVIAINYERRLEQRYGQLFTPWSLGRTRIINTAAFTFTYKLFVKNSSGVPVQYYGRVVFITPHLHGDRTGLVLSMLQRPETLDASTAPSKPTPDAVGSGGPVQEPLEHLRIS